MKINKLMKNNLEEQKQERSKHLREKLKRFKELFEKGENYIAKVTFVLIASLSISLGGIKCGNGTIEPPVIKDESVVDVKIKNDGGTDVKDGASDEVGQDVSDVNDVADDVEDVGGIDTEDILDNDSDISDVEDSGDVSEDVITEDVSDGGNEVADTAGDAGVDIADVVPCDSSETATEPIPPRVETTEGGITVEYSFEGTQEYNICTHEVVSQNIDSVLIGFTPPLAKGNGGIPSINPSIEFFGERYIVQEIRPDPVDPSGKRLQVLLIKPASEYTEFYDCSGLSAKRHTLLDLNFKCNFVSSDKTMLDFFTFANSLPTGLGVGGIDGKYMGPNKPPVPLVAKLIGFKYNENPKEVKYTVMAIENNYYYVIQNDMLRYKCIKGDKCEFAQLPPYPTMMIDGSEWKTDITAVEPNTEKCTSNTPCVSSIKFTRNK